MPANRASTSTNSKAAPKALWRSQRSRKPSIHWPIFRPEKGVEKGRKRWRLTNRRKVLLKCLPGFCADSLLKDRRCPMENRESAQQSAQLIFSLLRHNQRTFLPLIRRTCAVCVRARVPKEDLRSGWQSPSFSRDPKTKKDPKMETNPEHMTCVQMERSRRFIDPHRCRARTHRQRP